MTHELLVVFSHGKESGPWGRKIQALAAIAKGLGGHVISVEYRVNVDGAPSELDPLAEADRRVAQLLSSQWPTHRRLVLVGSSMGAYVSTVASTSLSVDGLFLLAPAFFLAGYATQDPCPNAKHILLIHGWRDEIVPVDNSIRFAEAHKCGLHLLDGDHRLNDALPSIEPLFDLFLRQVLADTPSPI